jgi:hypothetical protein
VLLVGALDRIESACEGRMPQVWTHISPENQRARALFARHGFKELPYAGEGEITYVRQPYAETSFDKAGGRLIHLIARLRGAASTSAPPLGGEATDRALTPPRRA